MVGTATLGLMLLAPIAPVPAQPAVPANQVERTRAQEFARLVYNAADQVASRYVRPVEVKELIEGAVRGLYEECGTTVPDRVAQAVRDANGHNLLNVLVDVRLLLANQPALRGPRALVAAVNGFRYATEPACQLASPRVNAFASADMEFGIGIELEGVTGTPWLIYQVEYKTASGYYAPVGWLEPPLRTDAIPTPAGSLWRVKRVIPDSPAQKAGVKVGDVITHLNRTEITADNANKLFGPFALPPRMIDPQTGAEIVPERVLTFRRAGVKSFRVKMAGEAYTPASAFGVVRNEDKWDCLLDHENKIGYIRLGAVESGLDTKVAEMLAELDRKGCRALVLDLRWCPGGYVDPSVRIAGLFLPNNAPIAQMKYRSSQGFGDVDTDYRNTDGPERPNKYPLVVLAGNETTGGGELIAAALRDNNRCVLMGQRTVGRASIQHIIEIGFGGLNYKVTTGESFRPNGKSRQRKPDSGPTDDWGLKPDEGLEVPITKDKSAELRRWAEQHALRPFDSTEGLDFDDPALDPYRLKALDYLRKKLNKPNK